MKKTIAFLILSLVLMNCSNATDSGRKEHYALPEFFPLKNGNAWVYERHYNVSGLDSMALDTLYVFGEENGIFRHSWKPEEYYNLVKQEGNKLLIVGMVELIDEPDTFRYDQPVLSILYGQDSGSVDLEPLRADYLILSESLHIATEADAEYFNDFYDVYITSETITSFTRSVIVQKITTDGVIEWSTSDLDSGEPQESAKMIKRLKNVYPPENAVNKAASLNKRKTHYRSLFVH